MTAMADRETAREAQARRGKYIRALAAAGAGVALTVLGAVMGAGRSGDAATGWGVVAGVGVGLVIGGTVIALLLRLGGNGWRPEEGAGRRERLQRQRVWMLWLLPLATVAFLVQSSFAMQDIVAGEGAFTDYISAGLPVLYAWVVAMITLGWDHQSRTHRRFLEDELTGVLRARAITAAFGVLMLGATLAFALGLWRADYGVRALPFVLAAAGATAGIRFAWLDREFGKDG